MDIVEMTRTAAAEAGLTEEIRFPAGAYTDPRFDTVLDHVGRDKLHGARFTAADGVAYVFYPPAGYIDIVDTLQHLLLNYASTLDREKSAIHQRRNFASSEKLRARAVELDEEIRATIGHYVWTLAAIR